MSRIATPILPGRPDAFDGGVKSAQRTIEILEFFAEHRSAASVVQISEALGYPVSSTSVLLRSLAASGYLVHDEIRRTYITSRRVAALGAWLLP